MISGQAYSYSAWPAKLARQIAEVSHPAVGICLDTGHDGLFCGFLGLDSLKVCSAVAPFVNHIHLHDNFGRVDPLGEPEPSERLAYGLGDLHLPSGQRTLPLEELFGEVEFPWEPTCCVELTPGVPTAMVENSLRSVRALVKLAA